MKPQRFQMTFGSSPFNRTIFIWWYQLAYLVFLDFFKFIIKFKKFKKIIESIKISYDNTMYCFENNKICKYSYLSWSSYKLKTINTLKPRKLSPEFWKI